MRIIPYAALALLVAPAAAQDRAPDAERVRCQLNAAPERDCRMTDVVKNGVHRMTFIADGQRVTFVGRKQTGWWAGKLNGRPAMGYERNRGNMVFATHDLKTSFAWWYPGMAHGTY